MLLVITDNAVRAGGKAKFERLLWLQKFVDGNVDEIGKLNHSLDANIVHRAFDLGNMRLRDACLFLNIALAQACVFSGCAEVSCETIALQLAFDCLIAFVMPAFWRLMLCGDCCGFLATRSVKTDFRRLRNLGGFRFQSDMGNRPRTLPAAGQSAGCLFLAWYGKARLFACLERESARHRSNPKGESIGHDLS